MNPRCQTNPLKTITDPLQEIKMAKTDPKKVPSPISFCSFLYVQFPDFLRKKNPSSQSL